MDLAYGLTIRVFLIFIIWCIPMYLDKKYQTPTTYYLLGFVTGVIAVYYW